MNCKFLRLRSKNYERYWYCKFKNKRINKQICQSCQYREYKQFKAIKKKSSKLAKLERQRDKSIVKYGKCEYCHNESEHLDPHEIYGGSNRKRSILNGFVKKLCRECHSDERIINQLRIDTQIEFEKTHTREEFIKIVGKSYL